MAEQVSRPMTAAEFLALPETNLPQQLLNGAVFPMTVPELNHQDIVGNVFVLFKAAAKAQGGKAYVAPVDVYFDAKNVPQPDIIYLAPESRCQPLGSERLSGPPDLVVEVLSRSTAREDRGYKFRLYQQYGVREYWIADPRDQIVEVWQYTDGHFVLLDAFGLGETFTSALIGVVDTNAIFEG